MLEYFPTNYVWNLSTNIALLMGGNIGEVDIICRKLGAAAKIGDDSGTVAFFEAWCEQADQLVEIAQEDEKAGRKLSAGSKYGRAAAYYITAERMQDRHFAPRKVAYRQMLECFAKYLDLGKQPCERIDVPYKGKTLAALFTPAASGSGTGGMTRRSPCIAFFNGLDSTKEMIYGSRIGHELARRGIATLMVDQPGVGEALRLEGLTAVVEAEEWAGACVDALESRADVDNEYLGVAAWSLGGYFAPRAAAFEKRFKLCVAWGANFNWGELQKRRLAREGDRPVPHYWEHVMWVWGQPSMDAFMAFTTRVSLVGVVEKITVPFLITHGANDRQIPLEYAHQSYAEATNSPRRELKLFTDREGGVEHVSADNMEPVRSYIADWVVGRFEEMG